MSMAAVSRLRSPVRRQTIQVKSEVVGDWSQAGAEERV